MGSGIHRLIVHCYLNSLFCD